MTDDDRFPDTYAAIPDLYDLEHDAFIDDVDFYLNFVEAVGDPVLELGCGTGRLLLPIAQAGYRLTGVDRSVTMLDMAARKLAASAVDDRVRLHIGEMTALDDVPGGPFGVAILSLNGLLHVSEAGAQRAVLTAVRKALDPRGQLLIDVLNPTPETLRSFDHSVVHEGAWIKPDGTRVDKISARRVSVATQTIWAEIWYDLTAPDGGLRRVATSMTMRYVHRSELELMLEFAGFAEWQIYGSYDLDPYDDHAERLIVAAEVTPS
jgi:SAM-dependent methyltransferase